MIAIPRRSKSITEPVVPGWMAWAEVASCPRSSVAPTVANDHAGVIFDRHRDGHRGEVVRGVEQHVGPGRLAGRECARNGW